MDETETIKWTTFRSTVCQGITYSLFEDVGELEPRPVLFDTKGEAEREMADWAMTALRRVSDPLDQYGWDDFCADIEEEMVRPVKIRYDGELIPWHYWPNADEYLEDYENGGSE